MADSPTNSAPTSPAPTTHATTSAPVATTTISATPAKPVSALLAGYTAPITTSNMPKANATWLAAVQKTMDDGTAIAQHRSVRLLNLVALVDQAARTSDLDALVKLCDSCIDPTTKTAFVQAMTHADESGRTGFAQLSFLLERTHPAQPFTQSGGGDFPGFTTPQHTLPSNDPNHATLTAADKSDMKALGVTTIADYKGIKIEFMNLDDGPQGYDAWIGLVPAS